MRSRRIAAVFVCAAAVLGVFTLGFFAGRHSLRADFTVETGYSSPAPRAISGEHTAGLININTADIDELTQLPGIGEGLAERIIEYRETVGPFEYIDDIRKVSGIGDGIFESIRDYITI